MLLVTKLTIISNLCSRKGIKVMKNSTFFEILCKDKGITGVLPYILSVLQTGGKLFTHHFIGDG